MLCQQIRIKINSANHDHNGIAQNDIDLEGWTIIFWNICIHINSFIW